MKNRHTKRLIKIKRFPYNSNVDVQTLIVIGSIVFTDSVEKLPRSAEFDNVSVDEEFRQPTEHEAEYIHSCVRQRRKETILKHIIIKFKIKPLKFVETKR